jgi:predicted ribosome quality control (RQC) complex YloA/Tae2 family protein
MSLNWKEIDLVLSELDLPGAQIQKVWQSAFDVLAMQVYGGKADARSRLILVCLSPLACRIHETFRPVPKSEKPLRFAEFLKARIVNGRIEEAVQLADNRIIRIIVRRGETAFRLYIRLWSNAANVIVTDEDGIILDAMKRLPKRGETRGGVYQPEQPLKDESAAAVAVGTDVAAGVAKPSKKYEVRELPGEGSFNSRVDAWYAGHEGKFSLDSLQAELLKITAKNRNRLEAALERLREKESDYAQGGRYKEYADIILSQSPAENTTWIEAESFSSPGSLIRIELDPQKNHVKNAEGYYEKYRKAKNGLSGVREEIADGEKELEKILLAEKQLLEETNPLRLEALLKKFRRGFLPDSGAKAAKAAGGKKRPGLGFAVGDWLILVGRDASENDELLRRHVKGNDLWLHARDWAGGYVFIKNRPGKSIPLEILLDAANLALFYSKGRNNKKGDLYYTQVKYLRRAKDGPKGLVIPTQEKNLSVTMEDARLKRLEDAKV